MIRRFWLMPVLVLGFSSLLIYGATATEETVKSGQVVETDVTVQKLLERIDTLEQRIAKLEQRDVLVRQADGRQEQAFDPLPQGQKRVPETNPNENEPHNLWEPDESKSKSQNHTNGQTWSVRLLGHRK